jgi:hypothetical protein
LHRNFPLKHIIEGKLEGRIELRGNEEEHVSRYCITGRKLEDTGT